MTDKGKRKSPVSKGHLGRYSQEQKLEAMTRLAFMLVSTNGGVQSICENDETLPAPSTIWQWLFGETIDTSDKDKILSKMYAQAKQAQMVKMADDTLSIADDDSRDYSEYVDKDGNTQRKYNMVTVNRDRLRADTRKWLLSKLDRRNYGDKQVLEVKDSTAISLTDMMRQAQNRVANHTGTPEIVAPVASEAVNNQPTLKH